MTKNSLENIIRIGVIPMKYVEIKIINEDCEKNVELKFMPNMETMEILKKIMEKSIDKSL